MKKGALPGAPDLVWSTRSSSAVPFRTQAIAARLEPRPWRERWWCSAAAAYYAERAAVHGGLKGAVLGRVAAELERQALIREVPIP